MDTTETKSAAYHRLVNDGRWPEAQKYRLAQRDIFLSEGKHRDEARELSWASMIQEYPTPDDEMRQLLMLAESLTPDDSRNALLEPMVFAIHAIRALAPFAIDGTIPNDVLTRAENATTPRRNQVLGLAADNPRMFIDWVKEMLAGEIEERRKPPTKHDESVAVAMELELKSLPDLETTLQPLLERAEAPERADLERAEAAMV